MTKEERERDERKKEINKWKKENKKVEVYISALMTLRESCLKGVDFLFVKLFYFIV